MNILFISMDYPPTPGGISAHVYELAKALKHNGVTVTIVTRLYGNAPHESQENGITIFRIPLKYISLLYGLQIRNFTRSLLPLIQPDLIHIHGIGPLKWYNIHSIPLVFTNHTSGYLMRLEKGGWYRLYLLKRLFRKINAFLAPSNELLHTPFTLTAAKHYIPNGVDALKYTFNPEKRKAIREQLGIHPDEIAIIATRRLVEKNGMIYLARAARLIKHSKCKFIIIGDGPEYGAVREEFSENCGDSALLLGNKSHDEIIDYYNAADISVLPSLMEATSISGLEAMATSLPLIGTNVGGIPDLIEDGVNGYLCEPRNPADLAEKIDRLLLEDYQLFGTNSRKIVEEKFDWDIIAQRTMGVYRSLISEIGS